MRLNPALMLLAFTLTLPGCGSSDNPNTPSAPLVSEDLIAGTGATAAAGDTLTVNYGSTGQGPIPPDATLIFGIELLSIAGK